MSRQRMFLRFALTLFGSFAMLALFPALGEAQTHVLSWGCFGSTSTCFDNPQYIDVDAAGNVYVADPFNHRVQKYDGNGGHIQGYGPGVLNLPIGVVVDAAGNTYVTSLNAHKVSKFTSGYALDIEWGGPGALPGEFSSPQTIAIDGAGNLYVTDTGNDRVQKFDSNGLFLGEFGGSGTGPGSFNAPIGIGVDGAGNIYVADSGNDRVQKFDSNFNYLGEWGTTGTGQGEFTGPSEVEVDAFGRVFVAEFNLTFGRVQQFDTNGQFVMEWNTAGATPLTAVEGIAVDESTNHVFVNAFGQIHKYLLPPVATSVVGPSSVTFGGSAFIPPERMIDGSGLSGVGPLLSQTHSGGYGSNPSDGANFKAPATEVIAYPIDFALGGTFDLTDVHIWNYTHSVHAFYIDRDTKDIDIALSTDGINFTPAGSITLSTSSDFAEAVQSFPLTGTASHVRFQIVSIHGDPNANGAEAGLGEVRFEVLGAAPTPVEVSVPSVTATYNELLTIPVSISDADGLVAAEVFIEYDTALLTVFSAPDSPTSSTGTLTDGWSVVTNTEPGVGTLERLKIAVATDVNAATGPQTLINVHFTVNDVRVPASSALTLTHVLLNDGTPPNVTTDGLVTLVGNDGSIGSAPPQFIPREDLTVTVTDLDADLDGLANTDQVSVTATNLNNGDVVNATLPEDVATVGTFEVVVPTEFGLAAVVDATLQAQAGDVIEFSFSDALDSNGAGPIVRTAQSTAIGGVDGTVAITDATQPGDVVYIKVIDADLNTDPGTAETAPVVVTGSNGETETILVTEVDVDDEVFFGSLPSTPGGSAGVDEDGTINGAKGDVLTATYDDVVTALGDQLDRVDTDQVVDPFGDADGNALVQAFDAAQVLLHVLSPFITGLELIQANVDLDPVATGISPFDASLILQKRVGLISLFPAQTAPSTNHPQSTPSSPKKVVETRTLALEMGEGYLRLVADDRAGVLSGDVVLAGVDKVELAPELSEYLMASRPSEEGLRVVFAGARGVAGAGEVLRLYGAEIAGARLQRVQLNDGQIEARIGESRLALLPATTILHANAPNPFNPETAIGFDLGQAGWVQLEIFDALGQKVQTLVSGQRSAGVHQVLWRGVDERGQRVSSGVYFYRLQTGDYRQMRRMLLLK